MPSIFSTPKPTAVPAPAVMPTPDDDAIQAAKRQKAAALMAQSGRASTIYSQNSSDKFGA
jgi:hypothetical protein